MANHNRISIFVISLALVACAGNAQYLDVNAQKIDRISEEELARIMPKPIAILTLDDLVRLTKEGVNAEQIIEKISMSNSFYDLTPSQVVDLNQQGVDAKVLDYIHHSHELAQRNNVAEEINQREKIKRAELDKLKKQQWLERQQYMYGPACGYGYYGLQPYGYGVFGSRFDRRGRLGGGFALPLGCW
jgi:ferredoxin-fold anticodon binding domain-containing protein